MAMPGTTGLSWRQAWFELLNGRKIKLPSWTGYWKWENNTIMIHESSGEIIDIRETKNPAYTFTNIAENYWMILPDDYELTKNDEVIENFNIGLNSVMIKNDNNYNDNVNLEKFGKELTLGNENSKE